MPADFLTHAAADDTTPDAIQPYVPRDASMPPASVAADTTHAAYRDTLSRLRKIAARRGPILAELEAAAADGDSADVTPADALAVVVAERLGDEGVEALGRIAAGPEAAEGLTAGRRQRQLQGAEGLYHAMVEAAEFGGTVDDMLERVRSAISEDIDVSAHFPARLVGPDVADAARTLLHLIDGSIGSRP